MSTLGAALAAGRDLRLLAGLAALKAATLWLAGAAAVTSFQQGLVGVAPPFPANGIAHLDVWAWVLAAREVELSGGLRSLAVAAVAYALLHGLLGGGIFARLAGRSGFAQACGRHAGAFLAILACEVVLVAGVFAAGGALSEASAASLWNSKAAAAPFQRGLLLVAAHGTALLLIVTWSGLARAHVVVADVPAWRAAGRGLASLVYQFPRWLGLAVAIAAGLALVVGALFGFAGSEAALAVSAGGVALAAAVLLPVMLRIAWWAGLVALVRGDAPVAAQRKTEEIVL